MDHSKNHLLENHFSQNVFKLHENAGAIPINTHFEQTVSLKDFSITLNSRSTKILEKSQNIITPVQRRFTRFLVIE